MGFQRQTAPLDLAHAGLKSEVLFINPAGSRDFPEQTLEDNPDAYFPELFNALALAPKP